MSYIALARKWRPRNFSALVGQEHITKVLLNSLNQQRIHHAYLFTGTRGVGKTSVARILAKALNCEQTIAGEPCLQCDACLAIEEGRFIDLIEVDGASRTRVEDTRELLDNVQYRPTSGRFKIYLIDEVHMLSSHSFNALLKTLEEPPSHVKFLLATTDPQKLPITVLSRCLQFNLKPLSVEHIQDQIAHILQIEKHSFDSEAIQLIAKAADGSMRDALSLLDQAMNHHDHLETSHIKEMLGYSKQNYALSLLQALTQGNAQQLFEICRQMAEAGGAFRHTLETIIQYLHQAAIYQALPSDSKFIAIEDDLIQVAQQLSREDSHLLYHIALKGQEELDLAPTSAIGFEMTLLRMLAFKPVRVNVLAVKNEHSEKPAEPSILPPVESRPPSSVTLPPPLPVGEQEFEWGSVLTQLKLSGLALSAIENAEFVKKDGQKILLSVASSHQSLFTPSVTQRLEKELGQYFKETIKLNLQTGDTSATPALMKKQIQNQKQAAASDALQEDQFFQKLQEEFSGTLIKDSIHSLGDID